MTKQKEIEFEKELLTVLLKRKCRLICRKLSIKDNYLRRKIEFQINFLNGMIHSYSRSIEILCYYEKDIFFSQSCTSNLCSQIATNIKNLN